MNREEKKVVIDSLAEKLRHIFVGALLVAAEI